MSCCPNSSTKQAKSIHFIDEPNEVEKDEMVCPRSQTARDAHNHFALLPKPVIPIHEHISSDPIFLVVSLGESRRRPGVWGVKSWTVFSPSNSLPTYIHNLHGAAQTGCKNSGCEGTPSLV